VKLSKYKEDYYDASRSASSVARTSAFAGIALIWVFRVEGDNPAIPQALIAPVACLAIGLAIDLLQYVLATVIWGSFHRLKEKNLASPNLDPEVSHPHWFIVPIRITFWAKLAFITVGYFLIAFYVSRVWLGG